VFGCGVDDCWLAPVLVARAKRKPPPVMAGASVVVGVASLRDYLIKINITAIRGSITKVGALHMARARASRQTLVISMFFIVFISLVFL